MSIEAIADKTIGDIITTGEDRADSGISFSVRKMCSVLATIGFLGINLGLDRYGPRDIESSMFIWDPVNHDPSKKQKVHEIYAPKIAENRYATAALYAIAAPFSILGLVSYPFEKAADYVSVAAKRINRRYENSRVYKAFAGILDSISKRISIDEDAGIPDEKEVAYNIKPSPAVASLSSVESEGSINTQNSLEESIQRGRGGRPIRGRPMHRKNIKSFADADPSVSETFY